MDIRVNCVHKDHKLKGVHTFSFEERYILDVFPNELYGSWCSEKYFELLKAFAIVVRTYAYHRMLHNANKDFDVWDDSKSQNFRINSGDKYPAIAKAVKETEGMVITYKGEIIPTYYCASNGGKRINQPKGWKVSPYLYDNKEDKYTKESQKKQRGHGAGLSQHGAKFMALHGKTWREIINFYYKDVEVVLNYGKPVEKPTQTVAEPTIVGEYADKTICFDPGHYLKYNGFGKKPDGSKYWESEGVLDLGLHLEQEIPNAVLTRHNGASKELTLKKRAEFAKANNADVCISLHTNSSPYGEYDKSKEGIIVFYSIDQLENKVKAQRLADLIHKHTGIGIRAVKYRESKIHKNEDYLGMIDRPQDLGIPEVYLVEHGSHWQFAGDYVNNIKGSVKAYKEFFGVVDKETPIEQTNEPSDGGLNKPVVDDQKQKTLQLINEIKSKLTELENLHTA